MNRNEDHTDRVAEIADEHLGQGAGDVPIEAHDTMKAVRTSQMELRSVGQQAEREIQAVLDNDDLPLDTRRKRATEIHAKATQAGKDLTGRSQAALAVLERQLTTMALPKPPSGAADLANAREEIKARLDGLSSDEAMREVQRIASGSDRQAAGTLLSGWGEATLRRHNIDPSLVRAEALKAAETHGDHDAKKAAKALGDGLLNLRKAHGAAAAAAGMGLDDAHGQLGEAGRRAAQQRGNDIAEAGRQIRLGRAQQG